MKRWEREEEEEEEKPEFHNSPLSPSLLKITTGPPLDFDAQAHLHPCPHSSVKLHHFPLLGDHHRLLLAVWPPLLRRAQHCSEFGQSPEPFALPRLSSDCICCYSRLCVELVPGKVAHRGLGDGESLRGVAGDGTGESCEPGFDCCGLHSRGEQADGRERLWLSLLGGLRLKT